MAPIDTSAIGGIRSTATGSTSDSCSTWSNPATPSSISTTAGANAAVTDWAHYQDLWTSRILNRPHQDPEAYRFSSPIYHAEGLRDRLLLVHGLIDDNVHFQDAARLIQKLIELEKPFEVMVYPTERHTIETEPSRYDYVRRVSDFFEKHLLRRTE